MLLTLGRGCGSKVCRQKAGPVAKRNHRPLLQLATNQQLLVAALTIFRNYADLEYQPFTKYAVSNRPTQFNKKASPAFAKLAPTHNKLRNL